MYRKPSCLNVPNTTSETTFSGKMIFSSLYEYWENPKHGQTKANKSNRHIICEIFLYGFSKISIICTDTVLHLTKWHFRFSKCIKRYQLMQCRSYQAHPVYLLSYDA